MTDCVIAVKVTPKAHRNEVLGMENNEWRIRLAAVPAKGDANKELIRFLAKTLQLGRSQIELISGTSSRHKRLRCYGLTETEIKERLNHAIQN